MTGAWTTKSRSIGLWSQVNKYVDMYSAINDINPEEHWLKRWKELVTVHNIITKKRDFEFIAYFITGNPESTVAECLQYLFTLIAFLDQHINITAISINRNIQYYFNGDDLKPNVSNTNELQLSTDDQNSFAPLVNQHCDSESNAEQELESILDSDTPSQQPSETDVYNQALNSATSTLKKLSDYTTTTTNNDTPDNNTEENNPMLKECKMKKEKIGMTRIRLI